MSVTIDWSIWHNIPEDLGLQVECLFISLATPVETKEDHLTAHSSNQTLSHLAAEV
jgi:hypothetical protein